MANIVIGDKGQLHGAVLGDTLLFETSNIYDFGAPLLPSANVNASSGSVSLDAKGTLHLNGFISIKNNSSSLLHAWNLPDSLPQNWQSGTTNTLSWGWLEFPEMNYYDGGYNDFAGYNGITITNGQITVKNVGGTAIVLFPDVTFKPTA